MLHLEDNASDALLIQEYIRDLLPTVTFDTAPRLADITQERVKAADCVLLDLTRYCVQHHRRLGGQGHNGAAAGR